MNIVLTIQAPELSRAIESLAAAIQSKPGQNILLHAGEAVVPVQDVPQYVAPTPVQQAPVQQMATQNVAPQQQVPAQDLPQYGAPAPLQQAPVQQPVQQAPAQQQPPVAPTSAPTYSLDQIAVAATQLMDAGKRNELMQILATFGVQALTSLPTDQYGAFATQLRGLGANI